MEIEWSATGGSGGSLAAPAMKNIGEPIGFVDCTSEVRFQALEMAVKSRSDVWEKPEDTVKRAAVFEAFLRGETKPEIAS